MIREKVRRRRREARNAERIKLDASALSIAGTTIAAAGVISPTASLVAVYLTRSPSVSLTATQRASQIPVDPVWAISIGWGVFCAFTFIGVCLHLGARKVLERL
ncbi:hypothetical protein [Pararhizobium mangrovi]|uniref:Uncharacterized protein n=1 Tax=Pararhizobium mangrovi TaxID=2590452 RepID=A0A506U226_9HYPH|nr:hypothetical protein [Pararhizobium mangrovi]TPW27025.1 hypothetical protein FJU11_12845 [Pararhizobium mangrovi]